jgi:hypothetical protein
MTNSPKEPDHATPRFSEFNLNSLRRNDGGQEQSEPENEGDRNRARLGLFPRLSRAA